MLDFVAQLPREAALSAGAHLQLVEAMLRVVCPALDRTPSHAHAAHAMAFERIARLSAAAVGGAGGRILRAVRA